VAVARRRVRDVITAWDVPEALADAAVLVTSELVTNAIRAEPGAAVTLCLSVQAGRFRIAVHDSSPDAVSLRATEEPTADGGRGLVLVDALASEWGSQRIPGGKEVYAVFDLRPEAEG